MIIYTINLLLVAAFIREPLFILSLPCQFSEINTILLDNNIFEDGKIVKLGMRNFFLSLPS